MHAMPGFLKSLLCGLKLVCVCVSILLAINYYTSEMGSIPIVETETLCVVQNCTEWYRVVLRIPF